jgi:hypothetical protein
MKRFTTTIMVTALMGMAAVGCGSDDKAGGSGESSSSSSGASTATITKMLIDSGAPEDEAACVASKLEGDYSEADIQQFVDSVDGSDVPTDLLVDIGNALGECSIG